MAQKSDEVRCISLSTAPWVGKISENDFNQPIRYLFNEAQSDEDEMPKLIRIFSDDIGVDVGKFMAVIGVLEIFGENLKKEESRRSYNDVLSIIAEKFPVPSEGRIIKSNFISSRISSLFTTEKDALYAVTTIGDTDAFDEDTSNILNRVANLSQNAPDEFLHLIENVASLVSPNKYGIEILRFAIHSLDKDSLNALIETHWSVLFPIIGLDELYFSSGWWVSLKDEHFTMLQLAYSANDFSKFYSWNELLDKALSSNCLMNENLCMMIVNNAERGVHKVLDFANTSTSFLCPSFLSECNKHEAEMLIWAKDQTAFNERVVRFFIHNINPNSTLVIHEGSNVWLPIMTGSYNIGTPLYIFVYELAHNWKDSNAISYLRYSFYPIYNLLENSNVSEADWKKILPYCEVSSMIPTWDKCKSFRKGLVKYLKSINCPIRFAKCFTPDEELNKKLIIGIRKK